MAWNILSSLSKVVLFDFPVSDEGVLDPLDTDAAQQGDWFTMDNTAGNEGRITPVAADAVDIAFPVWSRRGEGSIQFSKLLSVILVNQIVADTDRFDSTQAFTAGMALTVRNRLLVPHALIAASVIVGVCILPPDANNNMLRLLKV